MSSHCKYCCKQITWGFTHNLKKAPYNLDGTPHLATCKQAQKHRARQDRIAKERVQKELERQQPVLF